jgi:hypothetical protein
MRDLKIGAWFPVGLFIGHSLDPAKLRCEVLVSVAETFIANYQRPLALSRFANSLHNLASRVTQARIAAATILAGKPCHSFHDLPESSKSKFNEVTEDVLAGKTALPFRPDSAASFDAVHLQNYLNDDELSNIETLMSSQILLTWTAFETMAGDLWEKAINAHPKTLASLASKASGSVKRQGDGKLLPMSYLERHDYKIEQKMGTILRDHRFRFQKTDDIERAYRSAFPETECNAGRKDFWTNPAFRAISAMRNVIVHKAGKIDDEFVKKRGTDPRLSHYRDGDQLLLDGELIQTLFREFFRFAQSLIESVDTWIADHP